jgi:hypothetical protein
VARAKLGTAEIDVRYDFIQRQHVVFTVALCRPRLADDTWTALRAQRAFEIACSTLEVIEL